MGLDEDYFFGEHEAVADYFRLGILTHIIFYTLTVQPVSRCVMVKFNLIADDAMKQKQ